MSKSSQTLPPPLTSSAREARFSFYCTLCSKGYQRVHEYEAHENSYDHQHKKRFQEMKALQKRPVRPAKPSIVMKPITLDKPVEKKRGGFKSAFGGGEPVRVEGAPEPDKDSRVEEAPVAASGVGEESESEDEGWEGGRYDPARPTGP